MTSFFCLLIYLHIKKMVISQPYRILIFEIFPYRGIGAVSYPDFTAHHSLYSDLYNGLLFFFFGLDTMDYFDSIKLNLNFRLSYQL
jgi:hypothetical protein